MKDFSKKNQLTFVIFFVFLLIYMSPMLVNLVHIYLTENRLVFFNGTNFNGGTRTIQYLPILNEIVSEGNFFQNSVDQLLPKVNFENIRIAPFLIASLPSLFFNDISIIIFLNYLFGYLLNVFIIYLIIYRFIRHKPLAIYLSATCFLISGIIKFDPIDTLINIFNIQNRVFLDYDHISPNIGLIFQTYSNFILLLFFFLFINIKENQNLKKYISFITVFIFLGFSYQVHFIIGYGIIFISFFLDLYKKEYKLNLLFTFSTLIFISISIFQIFLIKEGSWSSADYSEFNNFQGFLAEISNIFSKLSIKNLFKFFINNFFLIPIFLFFCLKNEKKILNIYVPVFIISILFSFLFYNLDFLNALSTRILVRGADVLITVGIFLSAGLLYKNYQNNIFKTIFISFLVYISLVPSVKLLNMAKFNYESKRFFSLTDRFEIYDFLNKNVSDNNVVVSDDPYDWELIPVYTNLDMYYSNIFNSYRDPKIEILRYFDFLNFIGVSYDEFINDFSKIIEIRKKYKENAKKIRNKEVLNYKILNNDEMFKIFLISRNMLGFSMTHGLIFNKFNQKEIKYSKENFEKTLFTEMRKVYNESNPENLLEVDYIVLNKSLKLKNEYQNYFQKVFQNNVKVVYKKN